LLGCCEKVSETGDTARCVNELFEPATETDSRDPTSGSLEVVDDCELIRRGITGRLLAVEAPATNFLVDPVAFFLAGEGAGLRNSRPVAAVLPDDTIWLSGSSSSADSGGDTNRAVGLGPDDEGPLAFFRMGCEGRGFEAEETWLFKPLSLDLASGDGSRVSGRGEARRST
jgi:hypothetical protein